MAVLTKALLAPNSESTLELRKLKVPVTVLLAQFTAPAGSDEWLPSYLEERTAALYTLLQQRGGSPLRSFNDGLLAWFDDPAKAIQASIDLQQAMETANREAQEDGRVYLRSVLHHGVPRLCGAAQLGDVVSILAALAERCPPAQILASEAVFLLAPSSLSPRFYVIPTSQASSKASPEAVYTVLWTAGEACETLQLEPPAQSPAAETELGYGRYFLLSELGRGGMGVVYKAYDRMLGRLVALKTVLIETEGAQRDTFVQRLQVEARAAGRLDHPNIVTVYDAGEEAGLLYFTMQYVEGRLLSGLRERKELLPLDQVLKIAEDVCSALAYAHEHGVVHRDIKPSNLIITKHGNVKVMDFGIAKLQGSGLTQAGMILGSPNYMAPEQAAGRRIDARVDIFSLGAVLYELVTAERAFPGENTATVLYKILHENPTPPSMIEPSIPPALNALILKPLEKDPNNRFQNCGELKSALEALRRSQAAGAAATVVTFSTQAGAAAAAAPALAPEPEPAVPFPVPWFGKRTNQWVAAAVAVTVAVAVGIFAFTRPKPVPPKPTPGQVITTPGDSGTLPPTTDKTIPGGTGTEVPDTKKEAPNTKEAPGTKDSKTVRGETKKSTPDSHTTSGTKAPKDSADSGLFNRAEIPDMLKMAERYAGDERYAEAVIVYNEILHMDPQNRAAREGLRRAKEAQRMANKPET
jgi:serine/threonine-protein kinase